jgi:hypothetical protein
MAGQEFEAAFTRSARRAYAALAPDDQAEVDRLVAHLESDPWLDGRTKLAYASDVLPLAAYVTEGWAIIDRLVDNHFIEVWAIRPKGFEWRRRYIP